MNTVKTLRPTVYLKVAELGTLEREIDVPENADKAQLDALIREWALCHISFGLVTVTKHYNPVALVDGGGNSFESSESSATTWGLEAMRLQSLSNE